MMYEFRVSEMAEEFGVHRNTIRNWINAGTLPAKEGPGRKYLMRFEDYHALCEKFGREPHYRTTSHVDLQEVKRYADNKEQPKPMQVGFMEKTIYADADWADTCLTCGTCASACPIAGVDGLDPRKIVRMAVLGMEDELKKTNWPWKCTMCGKCENACPAGVKILALMRRLRGLRERDLVPGPIHKGVVVCLERGNNLGIPKDDFIFLCEELGEELEEEGLTGFKTPLDKVGARVMVTVNSKEPFAEPDDMKYWWRIFHAAGESWTIPTEYWEGVNWGLFSGDDEAMKTVVGRLVDNMRRLKCEVLLLPE
jgi:excisionase family DNA binding protein